MPASVTKFPAANRCTHKHLTLRGSRPELVHGRPHTSMRSSKVVFVAISTVHGRQTLACMYEVPMSLSTMMIQQPSVCNSCMSCTVAQAATVIRTPWRCICHAATAGRPPDTASLSQAHQPGCVPSAALSDGGWEFHR